jgi:hypothetical protein
VPARDPDIDPQFADADDIPEPPAWGTGTLRAGHQQLSIDMLRYEADWEVDLDRRSGGAQCTQPNPTRSAPQDPHGGQRAE